ncbi:hypothetical protein MIR68_000769 [Amoeboaphelidium protococcarum]|nr:hypothetical protein MIR68_000769 [Amoeboaphelidium protococcarum]
MFTLVRADQALDVAVPIEMDYPNQELMLQYQQQQSTDQKNQDNEYKDQLEKLEEQQLEVAGMKNNELFKVLHSHGHNGKNENIKFVFPHNRKAHSNDQLMQVQFCVKDPSKLPEIMTIALHHDYSDIRIPRIKSHAYLSKKYIMSPQVPHYRANGCTVFSILLDIRRARLVTGEHILRLTRQSIVGQLVIAESEPFMVYRSQFQAIEPSKRDSIGNIDSLDIMVQEGQSLDCANIQFRLVHYIGSSDRNLEFKLINLITGKATELESSGDYKVELLQKESGKNKKYGDTRPVTLYRASFQDQTPNEIKEYMLGTYRGDTLVFASPAFRCFSAPTQF